MCRPLSQVRPSRRGLCAGGHAPDDVADALLSRGGNWRLPILSGITNTPFLRRDGSICEMPGYDAAGGLLYKPGDKIFPSISPQPSRDDALEALQLLED